jgi:C_GCAxxG_C_C family probable redox protein
MSRDGGLLMNNPERALELFANGLNCSQALLTLFGKRYGLDSAMAGALGRPLGGGMGHLARTCGAVVAAVLLLGMATDAQEETEARTASDVSVREFFRRFERRHGTTECKELLGVDMSTEEGMKRIRAEKLVQKRCPAFVEDAAGILDELLSTDIQ